MIKMKTGVSGSNFSLKVGEITDRFSKEEETRYIEAGLAEPVKSNKKKAKKKAK